jgi:hypothetical protein
MTLSSEALNVGFHCPKEESTFTAKIYELAAVMTTMSLDI